jgi:hypothetical protein
MVVSVEDVEGHCLLDDNGVGGNEEEGDGGQ